LARRYPAEVALNEEGEKELLFRRFIGTQRLYTYDLNNSGHSACNLGCDRLHPPVDVSGMAKPILDWAIIQRDNRLCQWAYKGLPLYTFFHDMPNNPKRDEVGRGWHLVGYTKKRNLVRAYAF
jgi:predicted lipoprotein with Yx(FWY)xxD motif